MDDKNKKDNENRKLKLDLYAKYIGKNKIKTTELDKFCDKIQEKYGYDVIGRILSAVLEYFSKEELKNFDYELVPLDDLTIKEFKKFPGIFVDYNPFSFDDSEKGFYKCLYDYPIFDHPYAVFKNKELVCICAEPYNVSGKDITEFIVSCEKAGNHVEISGRGTHFPGRSFLIKIFPIIPKIEIVCTP